jgi:hypothetical protein
VKVLIIPEDQLHDRYIACPVIQALLEDLGITARVDVLPEPRLRGFSQALDPKMIAAIVADNPMVDLFLLIVDRDCDRNGADAKASTIAARHAGRLLACVAIQELEVWMLALHLQSEWSAEIRSHCDPKERWADPLLERLGTEGPGAGRKKAMRALKGKWRSLRSRCPELADLQAAIKAWREAPLQPQDGT